ncbi:hypothetical protein QLQ09_14765 [Brucella sp. NM4]|uniref:hypothetical protein n=1 Tax=Brucella sp. NM4 TaxID=3045175 RepID=UPI0024BC7F18|nr:hypothetical protein [Brucella sp. NM4]WHS31090.1 hypothetical protein QLQ09_14765 [Brucella sp. NM4]
MRKIFAAAIALSFISAPVAFAAQSHISSGLVHQVKAEKKAKAKKPSPQKACEKAGKEAHQKANTALTQNRNSRFKSISRPNLIDLRPIGKIWLSDRYRDKEIAARRSDGRAQFPFPPR